MNLHTVQLNPTFFKLINALYPIIVSAGFEFV